MNATKKSLLAICAAAFVAPLLLGCATAPPAITQAAIAPHPGTEAALRHQIESMEKGLPDFEVMAPRLARAARLQIVGAEANIQKWGALKSIAFLENDNVYDVYLVEFENQMTVWTVGPIQPDGKIGSLDFRPAIKRDGNGPSPGTEAALHRLLDARYSEQILLFYDLLGPRLAGRMQQSRRLLGENLETLQALGPVKSVTFQKVTARGWDEYQVRFANGTQTAQVAPLTDGKLTDILLGGIMMPPTPQHPGTQASLRRYIESLEKGQPNYDEMESGMADAVKQQLPDILAQIKNWGALQSIVFKSGGPQGMDAYDVTFEHGKVEWDIAPLDSDGKVVRRGFHQVS